MKNTKRRAFTLVELLIVIAILAILSTVTIVGFNSFTEKAKQSNDEMLVSQLNNLLSGEEKLSGKPKTMHHVIEILHDNGFLLENLTPTSSKNEFVWDQASNRFSIIKEEELLTRISNPNQWILVDDEIRLNEITNKYSVYLTSTFKENFKEEVVMTTEVENTVGDGIVTVKNGFDAGEYVVSDNSFKVKYVSSDDEAKTVNLNTNGGDLYIDAPLDTINHYGKSKNIDIIAVAGKSYHENGAAENIQIAKGRIELTKTAEVKDLVVKVSANAPKEEKVVVEASKEIAEDKKPAISVIPATKEDVAEAEKVQQEIAESNKDAGIVVTKATPVGTYEEFSKALKAKEKNIVFTANIEYGSQQGKGLLNISDDLELNGQGFTLKGYGLRPGTSQHPTLTVNLAGVGVADHFVKVTIKNLTIISDVTYARVIETRGMIDTLTIENCNVIANAGGNPQGITIGGNQSEVAKVNIKNTNISALNSGYAYISFNPANLTMENCVISAWGGLYFKGIVGSAGSSGSTAHVKDTKFICKNYNKGNSNTFGTLVFEDGNIDVVLEDTYVESIKSKAENENQYLVLFSDYAKDVKKNGGAHVTLKGNCKVVTGDNQLLETNESIWDHPDETSDLIIEGGLFNCDPSDYLAPGYKAVLEGMAYRVVKA